MSTLSAVLDSGREVFRYQVDFGDGERDVVSLLEPEWVSQYGLHPEAVIAVLPTGTTDGWFRLPSEIENALQERPHTPPG